MDIDIVVAWVDGSDPAWQAERNRYGHGEETGRWREPGLLRYWFRCVAENAPWVRKIHFVTWGHIPDFLNPSHPKIRIVRHGDFIPREYLPTFSSHTIELNLHRIGGLSENFVYFNDDMYLLSGTKATDFFRSGTPCLCAREEPWAFRGYPGVWSHAAANDLGIINRHFPKRNLLRRAGSGPWQDRLRSLVTGLVYPGSYLGFVNVHGPSPLTKGAFRRVWAAEGGLLDAVCRRKFRDSRDVNQWLILWWQIGEGHFIPREMDNLVLDLSDENISTIRDTIRHRRHDFLCLNDPGGKLPVDEAAGAFESVFPGKCEYEL